MVPTSSRGGVPVFRRESGSLRRARVVASAVEGGSTSSDSRINLCKGDETALSPHVEAWRVPLRSHALMGAPSHLPAGRWSRPMCTTPRRKVPVVRTTAFARNSCPPAAITPQIRPAGRPSAEALLAAGELASGSSSSRSSTLASKSSRPGYDCSSESMRSRYILRSACARGPCTAGPFLRLSMRK
eukprot:scaffold310771_cov30-Tisochrysis_lutea.AAC.2